MKFNKDVETERVIGAPAKVEEPKEVEIVETPAPKMKEEKVMTAIQVFGRVVKGKLNLRQAPSVSAAVMKQIPDGDKVEILEDKGEWFHVKYDNLVGFVKSEFVNII